LVNGYWGGLKMKQILVHKIDLLKLEGNGDFLCPYCGTRISPDDETEEAYSILEPKVRNNTLECLMIRCNHCSNKILLTGFSVFEL
jgi:DNA-directed RNA polymerase subunit RPC12/RpoP